MPSIPSHPAIHLYYLGPKTVFDVGVEQNFVLWQELPEFSFFSFLFAMVQFARSNLWIKQTLSAINFDTFHVWSNLYAIIPEYLK